MSKALRFLLKTAKHQDCPFTTVTKKTASQNISITLLQISLKLHDIEAAIAGKCSRKRFRVRRNTAAFLNS